MSAQESVSPEFPPPGPHRALGASRGLSPRTPALGTARGVGLSGGSEHMGASRAVVRSQGIPCRPSGYKHLRAEEEEEGKHYSTLRLVAPLKFQRWNPLPFHQGSGVRVHPMMAPAWSSWFPRARDTHPHAWDSSRPSQTPRWVTRAGLMGNTRLTLGTGQL